MFPRIKDVQYLHEYVLRLSFVDGVEAELDFANKVVGRGGVFAPLAEIAYFAQVTVDPEAQTLIWPNGLDLDPDLLYAEATGIQLSIPQDA
jgi:hypothetical protein